MQQFSYTDCYKELLIDYPCPPEDLKKYYRKQIQQWHPDKFPGGSDEHTQAEEKIKRLNQSFKILSDYVKRNGELPLPESARRTRAHAATNNRRYRETKQAVTDNAFSARKLMLGFFSLTIIIGFIIILIWENTYKLPHKPILLKPSSDTTFNSKNQFNNIVADEKIASAPPPPDLFSKGDSVADVLAIQGKPDKIDTNIWYYGNSVIVFDKGKVIHWEENDHYLRARKYGAASSNVITFPPFKTRTKEPEEKPEPTYKTYKPWLKAE